MSNRQKLCDKLRKENKRYRYGVWTVWDMSNRQILKKFKKQGEKVKVTEIMKPEKLNKRKKRVRRRK